MSNAVIKAELKALLALSQKDQGDFLVEAQRLIGRNAFDILWKSGIQSIRGIFREVRRIAMQTDSPEQTEIRSGQEAAAQCHS